MCMPASMIVTKEQVYWSTIDESHSKIIAEFNLREEFGGKVQIVRVEIVPSNNNYSLPISDWEFRVDQDLLPNWWDEVDAERRARAALQGWYAAHVVTAGEADNHLRDVMGSAETAGRAYVRMMNQIQKIMQHMAEALRDELAKSNLANPEEGETHEQ
jgi:hypothetical protein